MIVLRHAKTEQEGATDRARVLTKRGRSDAKAAGLWLRDEGLAPRAILTSPAARADETARIVADALADETEITVVDDLYGADVDDVIDLVQGLDDSVQRVMVVGHNPTMAALAYDLQAAPTEPWAGHLPTAGIAVLAVPGGWVDLSVKSADLVHWYVPRG